MSVGRLKHRTRSALLFIAFAFSAASCADNAPTRPEFGYGLVRISPTLLSYGAGAQVRLELENVGPSVIFAGYCPDGLDIKTGAGWESVSSFDPTCEAALQAIDPGVIGGGTVVLPERLQTGLYRARYEHLYVATTDARYELLGQRLSEPFAVTAAPAR